MRENLCLKLGQEHSILFDAASLARASTDCLLLPIAKGFGRFFVVCADGAKYRVARTASPNLKLGGRQPADDCSNVLHGTPPQR